MKKLMIAMFWVLFATSTVIAANPHGQPPGNDGGYCHGANQEPCRPDPQPSHGQDCQPHGNNPDGNDDHCGPVPTATPTGSLIPPTTGKPQITLPPTDTE